jgi:hypothetical protein
LNEELPPVHTQLSQKTTFRPVMGIEQFMIFYFAVWHKPGLINLLCGEDNFGKVWSACRQYDIQYTE